MATVIRMPWNDCRDEENERSYTLVCSVYEGCPARGPSYASGGEPAEGPEVTVLKVLDAQRVNHPELVDVAQESVDVAEALERVQDAREAAAEARWEAWTDNQREARRERLNDTLRSIGTRH